MRAQLLCCWLRRAKLTNERRMGYSGGRALKRQELKQSISDRVGIQCCSTGQHKKSGEKTMNLKISVICLI